MSLFTQVGQLTINKIFSDKADYINAFSRSMLQREEVFSILAMSSRPAPCGSPAATIASAMRGSSASPGILTGCKAMEEFFLDSAWRGQRTMEERETLGEWRRTPRGRSPMLLPLDLVKLQQEKVIVGK